MTSPSGKVLYITLGRAAGFKTKFRAKFTRRPARCWPRARGCQRSVQPELESEFDRDTARGAGHAHAVVSEVSNRN